jgi:hypothetical protein
MGEAKRKIAVIATWLASVSAYGGARIEVAEMLYLDQTSGKFLRRNSVCTRPPCQHGDKGPRRA